MSEFSIKKPCGNCELAHLLEDSEGIELLALKGLFMAVCGKDALLDCRHPWRLLNQAYNEQPNEIQTQVLSKVVEIRGEDVKEYKLPKPSNISTLDI